MSTQTVRLAAGASAQAGSATGRDAWRLLWRTSRAYAVGVVFWAATSALSPAAVVIALGAVVTAVPATVAAGGLSTPAGHTLEVRLALGAAVYAVSLILPSVGDALGTAVRTRITSAVQDRLMAAVSGPPGLEHLEDPEVADRLAAAEGGLTGFFPGDAPVTWIDLLASRLAGLLGCLAVSRFVWWLGPALLVMWVLVRRGVLRSVVRQATELRGQTASMRRAWYFTGVGTKARDAKEVRVFGLPGFLRRRFTEEYADAMALSGAGLRRSNAAALIGLAVVVVGYAGALVVFAVEVAHHRLPVVDLAITIPMLSVTMQAGSVSFSDITLAWTLAALPEVDALERQLTPAHSDATADARPAGTVARPLPLPRASIRFERVAFRYPGANGDGTERRGEGGEGGEGTDAAHVLHGLDLELTAGRSTAIVGVNGAGKSTLVSLLAGLREPTGGRIVVDGTELADLDRAAWQRTIALMPQAPVHLPASAYDNIAWGALEHAADSDGVHRAADQAGFTAVADDLPDGWDTLLVPTLPGGVDLSGGQWQRLTLARALFATRHGARVLVLDEPTAALDVRAEAAFYRRFLELTAGLTTLVISHRFATVRQADRICVLDGGAITEQGSHEELVAAQGEYARLYAVQAARFGGGR